MTLETQKLKKMLSFLIFCKEIYIKFTMGQDRKLFPLSEFDIFCHLKEKYLEYSTFCLLTSKINSTNH